VALFPDVIHDADWHLDKYTEFAHRKLEVGEPRPHLALFKALNKGVEEEELLWRVGLYLNTYSIMTAEAVWSHWSFAAQDKNWPAFAAWVKDNWAGFHMRKDRRWAFPRLKFMGCLESYKGWCKYNLPELTKGKASYDQWWESSEKVWGFGDYIKSPMVNTFKELGYTNAILYDFRTALKDSPRKGLALFRPEIASTVLDLPAIEIHVIAGQIRMEILRRGTKRFNRPPDWLSWYNFATLTCEYLQSYGKGYEYPGNCHDEELEYLNGDHHHHWVSMGFKTRLFDIRKEIFPNQCLGELHGWSGLRKKAARWLKNDGVVWSDLIYHWQLSDAAERAIPYASPIASPMA
jgi:hypothetical protein